MRIITTTSRYSHYLTLCLGLLVLCLPTTVLGYTLSDATGCFERLPTVLRGTEPICTFTITPDAESEEIDITTENIDPDAVTASFAGDQLNVDYDDLLIISGTLSQSTTVTIAPWYQMTDELWFVAISDNQARGTVETNPVFEDILPIVNRINPPFMTDSGDLVQGSSNTETLEDMFSAVLASLENTTVPIYPIAGNHDYDPNLSTYTSFFGSVDYSFEAGPAKIVALSTSGSSSKGTVTEDQLSWLTSELDTSQKKIVFAHHPVSVPSWGSTACCYLDTTERDALAETLDENEIDLLVTGHSQGYDYRFLTSADISTIQRGFYQLVTGGAGGHIVQPDGDFHFTLLHVTSDGVELTPFYINDTSLAFDETNNNGNKDLATITSEYTGTSDLPYLRLKFDLNNDDTASYLVTDATGSYLPFQSHVYGDHRILFAAAEQAQNTTVEFTAQLATTLHVGTTNTANSAGHIQFLDQPSDDTADTKIHLLPSKLTTVITDIVATEQGYSWIETPVTRSVDTTYTITDLTDGDTVSVYLDDQLEKRLVVQDGEITFTLADNARQRSLAVQIEPAIVLSQIAIVPASLGSAQIRFFNSDSSNLRNFTAYAGTTGGFNLSYGKIRDGITNDILLSRPDQKVGLFSETGTQLDLVRSDAAVHAADVRGDDRAELVVQQGSGLRTYRWSADKDQFFPVDRLRVDNGLQDWMIADNKLVTISHSGEFLKLRQYRWHNGWKLKRRKRVLAESTVRISGLNDNVAVVTDSYVYLYDQQLTRLQKKSIPTHKYVQVLAGQLNNSKLDTLMLLDDQGTVYPYQSRSTGELKALPKIFANAHQMSVVQFSDHAYQSLITTTRTAAPMVAIYYYSATNERWTQRYLFSAYGSTFPGLANLAIQ